jgi:hypothetical protein
LLANWTLQDRSPGRRGDGLDVAPPIVLQQKSGSAAVRGALHLGHTESGWLLPIDYLLHGWALIAANVAFYLYLCWLAFCFIRGSEGRERIFMAGWFTHLVLYPLEKLWPLTAQGIQYIGTLALAVSILAAVSLLVHPAPAESAERTA